MILKVDGTGYTVLPRVGKHTWAYVKNSSMPMATHRWQQHAARNSRKTHILEYVNFEQAACTKLATVHDHTQAAPGTNIRMITPATIQALSAVREHQELKARMESTEMQLGP